MKYIYVTNNPLVKNKYKKNAEYILGTNLEVFEFVKKKIMKGYKLITHPLTGNITPDVIPYKTVIIIKSSSFNNYSLKLINKSIDYLLRLDYNSNKHKWSKKAKEDFKLLDLDFAVKALENQSKIN